MSVAVDLDLGDIAPVSTANPSLPLGAPDRPRASFAPNPDVGDRAIAAHCSTHDGTTVVPLYEFRPDKDGIFKVDGTILVWQENGATLQWSIQVGWKRSGGALEPLGTPFIGGSRKQTHIVIRTDVHNGKGRILVVGLENKPLYWRMKAVLFDLSS